MVGYFAYYTRLIESSTNNPRQLWSTINTISDRSKLQIPPEHDNNTILSNQFNQFFNDKVAQIRTDITTRRGFQYYF